MEAPYLARSRWLADHVLPHEPGIRAALCRSIQMAPADLDDVIQETYAVLARLESVDTIRDPKTYALQVARSVFLQGLRRNRVIPIGSMTDLAVLGDVDDAPSPEQQAHGQRELRRVEAAISDMPSQVRKVFWLRRVEGLSQRETAAALGLAEHTVEKYSAKGIKFLLRRFGSGGNVTEESSRLESPTLVESNPLNVRPRTTRRD
jgi:RNA polymerase sigma-70 factor (ECF subfamily)